MPGSIHRAVATAVAGVLGMGLGLGGVAAAAIAAPQDEFYVATTGSDTTGNGSMGSPWRTIERARDHIESTGLNDAMTGDINVYVAAGDYEVDQTIVFDELDSGSNGHSITYRNKDAVGSARFLGGEKITDWTVHSGQIYKAYVGTDWKFDTLYENGDRAWKARFPNFVPDAEYDTARAAYLSSQASGTRNILQYASGDLNPTGWNLTDAQAFVWSGGPWAWFTDTTPIASVNPTTRRFTLEQDVRYPLNAESRYVIQGVLQLLDQPGEFHLDTQTGYLYYWAQDGAAPDQTILAPKVTTLVSLQGSSEAAGGRVHHVAFDGLRFEGTDFTDWFRHGWPTDGASGEGHLYPQYDRQINMTQHRTGSVLLSNTHDVAIRNSHFVNTGYSAIFLLFYNQNNTISGNLIEHVGHSGIVLEGRYPGEGNVNKDNVLTNNLIHDVGELVGHGSGVYIMNSGGNEVSYSEIYNSPRYAVAFDSYVAGGTVPIPLSAYYLGENTIKNIRIHNTAQDSGDTAPVYSWGRSYAANTIDQVIIDGVAAHPSMMDAAPNGIFMDNESNGQAFSNIKISNTQGVPFRLNQSSGHTFSNVSWRAGFDDSAMDYANIGIRADFPYSRSSDLREEKFENGFANWTTVKGSPSASTAQAHTGTRSYAVDQDTDVISHTFTASRNGVVSLWFYDNAADTSMQTFARVDDTAAQDGTQWRGIGVNTATSTTKYVTRVGDSYAPTAVDRSTGWHEFTWDYRSGTRVDLSIDGTLVASPVGVSRFSQVAMGDWWSGGQTGAVFFDDLLVVEPFVDGFENGLGAWTAVAGAASASTAQAHTGSRSYAVDQEQDVITRTFDDPGVSRASVWFYDDAADSSMQTMARADETPWDVGTAWRGLGVNTPTSTTHYVTRIGGTYAVTPVARTAGWHEFEWDYSSGTKVDLYIDGILVGSPTGVTGLTHLSFGDWWGNQNTGAVFFDDVIVD